MMNVRIPMAICAAVADCLGGSHASLETLFEVVGAPGPPPEAPHGSKWKLWLYRAGQDESVDSLAILGGLIEEFMDLPPLANGPVEFLGMRFDNEGQYRAKRERLATILEQHGFRYYRGGRVMPIGVEPHPVVARAQDAKVPPSSIMPTSVDDLLKVVVRGLPRAMYPLTHRRKGAQVLAFDSEWDIQDLLHSHLRSWVSDIRPEEFTSSHAGSSTRMDFLLPTYRLVIEVKRVRSKAHAQKIGL